MLQAVCRPYVYRNRTSNDEGLICVLTYYVGKALRFDCTLSRLGESEVGLQKLLLEFVVEISGTLELYQSDGNVNFWSAIFLECFVFLAGSAQVVPSVLLALVLNVPRMLEMSPVKTHN